MSSLKHPVGSRPSKVYWRRRLVVGLGLVVILVVILMIVLAPRGKSDASAPVASTSHPSTSATTKSAPKHTTSPATVPTNKATEKGAPCKTSVVDIEAITDASSYSAGVQPQLSFSVTNTGTKSCVFDAGTAKQVFTITSGTEVYWKSTDCQKDPVSTQILLEPGKTLTSKPLVWDRTRSDPSTCSDTRPAVPAGGASYHLKVQVDGVTSKTTKQFLLY